jgi:hypothetical protein
MPTFIKTGFWEKNKSSYKGWLNLENLIDSLLLAEGSVKYVLRPTYASMIADGVPSRPTLYTVTNDENKAYIRSTYLWKPDGKREWIASTPDN